MQKSIALLTYKLPNCSDTPSVSVANIAENRIEQEFKLHELVSKESEQ
jgi:hypothetical protein